MHRCLNVLPQQVEVWTLTGLFRHPTIFFFTHYVVCCCALAHWCLNQIRPSFRCQTDGLTAVYKNTYRGVHCHLYDRKVHWSCVWATVVAISHKVFVVICCVWFSTIVALCLMAKHLKIRLICPKPIIPEKLAFSYKTEKKLIHADIFTLERRGFSYQSHL